MLLNTDHFVMLTNPDLLSPVVVRAEQEIIFIQEMNIAQPA
ncbi:MAG: hypothetical protein ABI668_06385 [Sphingorhabdus sp.]